MAAIVLAHFAVCLVHGAAHANAPVPLSTAATLFVFVVILIGPLAGLALTWPARRLGGWVIALTMFGSLVFGVVNHFLIAGADNVRQVEPAWQPLFATTAVLLMLIEAIGSGLAIVAVQKGQ
jgi:hypothetical protein